MSKRNKSTSEEGDPADGPNVSQEEPPEADTRRTRSGRRVRTPALLQDSVPVKAPSRRTRRSVLQELPPVDQTSAAEEPGPVCEMVHPTEQEHVDTSAQNTDKHHVETACKTKEIPPSNIEMAPCKKPRLAPPAVPLGKPKSGRVWKERNKQRFSSVVRDKQLCSSWEKKMQDKRQKQLVKQFSQQLKDDQNRQKEEKRKRREENLKRRAENERKAEIVQVIRNTAKIKRMKKKQLRKIEKRDTLALLQTSKDNGHKTKPKAATGRKDVDKMNPLIST